MIKGAGPGVLAQLIAPKHEAEKHKKKALFKPDAEDREAEVNALKVESGFSKSATVHKHGGGALVPAKNATDPHALARAQAREFATRARRRCVVAN